MRHARLPVAFDFDHKPHGLACKFGFREDVDASIIRTCLADERYPPERKLGYGLQKGLKRLCRPPLNAVCHFHRFAETTILVKWQSFSPPSHFQQRAEISILMKLN
jgi:hypothetical protein